jgi:DNA-binding MarR family transcriptional regulator
VTAADATHLADLDARLLAALERIGNALHKGRWDAAYAQRLSGTQAQLLLYLATHGGKPPRVGRLAEEFGLKHSTISDVLAALQAKGLLVRQPDPADQRATVIQLTPKGKKVASRLGSWAAEARQHLARLSPEAQAQLLATLLELIARWQQAGLIPLSRCCTTCLYFQPQVHADPQAPHHCQLLDQPLRLEALRVDCPDHQPAPAAAT